MWLLLSDRIQKGNGEGDGPMVFNATYFNIISVISSRAVLLMGEPDLKGEYEKKKNNMFCMTINIKIWEKVRFIRIIILMRVGFVQENGGWGEGGLEIDRLI